MSSIRNIFFSGVLFSISLLTLGQSDYPTRNKWNIGTFVGIGGASLTPIPTLDLRYRGTSLRLAPGYNYNGLGITQELFPISKTFYNAYWLLSFYYVKGTEQNHVYQITDYSSISGLFGLKYYMGTRFFSELQLGIENRVKKTPGFDSENKYSPYFEFGFGVNLFINFDKKMAQSNDQF